MEIQSSGYSVIISPEITKELNRFFKKNKNRFSKFFILVDENSLRHCYPQLVAEIDVLEDAEIIEVDSGEETKNVEVCSQIWQALSEYGADRNSLFINLGGGVISDLGGFIAGCYKRGIPFINIPTTLLSQVDASVGGKVGVDLNHLKNQVGLFVNPLAVFVYPLFLSTLDARQVLSGFAEMIKHALIADPVYWEEIKTADVHEVESLHPLIARSVEIKNEVVLLDPKEEKLRKVLNFGHTVGHAIESFSLEHHHKKPLLHGEAIAVGMVCEAYLSKKVCRLSDAALMEICDLIFSLYKPVKLETMDVHRLIELMQQDKKNEKGLMLFSLLNAIGNCSVNKACSADLIIESLQFYIQEVKHRRIKS